MTELAKDELLELFEQITEAEYYVDDGRTVKKELWTAKEEQAYDQIKALIETSAERSKKPNNKSIGKLAEEYNVPYSLVHALYQRVADDYKKPTEEVEE